MHAVSPGNEHATAGELAVRLTHWRVSFQSTVPGVIPDSQYLVTKGDCIVEAVKLASRMWPQRRLHEVTRSGVSWIERSDLG